MQLLIKNIHQLAQVESKPRKLVKGKKMKELNTLDNAYVLIENDTIKAFGAMGDCPDNADEVIDASGRVVMPAYCDSHTHLVFANTREQEYVQRIEGRSYEEIAAAGGGILNSAKRLQETEEAELLDGALERCEEIIKLGTGAVEIKSGYGLTVDSELKMLRVIQKLKEQTPLEIKSTFLGAHAYPTEYKNDHQGYIKLITEEMLPVIEQEGLADYIDVFCDRGFFDPNETNAILKAGKARGLKAKVHAHELDYSGGVRVGVLNQAISVDHLEFTSDREIGQLINSDTMPTLLPSTAFFLNLEYAPARKMIDLGLPIALASDYNPGSSPSGNMNFVLALACTKMNMLPAEALNAATINSAYAMELSATHGSIAVGKKANLAITKPMNSYDVIPYGFGNNPIAHTIINGKKV